MPSENAAIVRELYEGWSKGDFSDAEHYAPDIDFISEWDMGAGIKKARGVEGMAESWGEWLQAWEPFKTGEIDVLHEFGGDTVIVFNKLYGRGRGSGIEIELTGGAVFTFVDGRIVSMRLISAEAAREELESAG